ncbi:hypothetical protein CDIK_0515 [Cucumispora dikerogammari]|nr:hypothetical protein CDIK_0515 [Cucumispora dikerogammari]
MGNTLAALFRFKKPTSFEILELSEPLPYHRLQKHLNKLTFKYHPDRNNGNNSKYLEIIDAFNEMKQDPSIYTKEYFNSIKGKHDFEFEVNMMFKNFKIPVDFSNRAQFYRSLNGNTELRKLVVLIKEKEMELNKIDVPSVCSTMQKKKKIKEKKIKPFVCHECKTGYNLEKRLKEHFNTNKHKNSVLKNRELHQKI